MMSVSRCNALTDIHHSFVQVTTVRYKRSDFSSLMVSSTFPLTSSKSNYKPGNETSVSHLATRRAPSTLRQIITLPSNKSNDYAATCLVLHLACSEAQKSQNTSQIYDEVEKMRQNFVALECIPMACDTCTQSNKLLWMSTTTCQTTSRIWNHMVFLSAIPGRSCCFRPSTVWPCISYISGH